MDEQEREKQEVMEVGDGNEPTSLTHDERLELETLHFRFQMTTVIVASVLFLAGMSAIWNIVAEVKHFTFSEPSWLADVVKMTVSAGLVLLGVHSLQALNESRDKKKEK